MDDFDKMSQSAVDEEETDSLDATSVSEETVVEDDDDDSAVGVGTLTPEQIGNVADAIIEVSNESEDGQIITDDMANNKEAIRKLNERLGITDKDSLFSFDELKKVQNLINESREEFKKFSEDISSKKKEVEDAAERASKCVGEMEGEGSKPSSMMFNKATNAVASFQDALASVTSLITTGQDIVNKLYMAIASTDLVDPDVIEATAKVIEGVRISVADIIAFNTNKMNLEHQFNLAIESEKLKQQHRLELEYFKSKLRREELKEKSRIKAEEEKAKAIDGTPAVEGSGGGVTWSYNDAIAALRQNSESN